MKMSSRGGVCTVQAYRGIVIVVQQNTGNGLKRLPGSVTDLL